MHGYEALVDMLMLLPPEERTEARLMRLCKAAYLEGKYDGAEIVFARFEKAIAEKADES